MDRIDIYIYTCNLKILKISIIVPNHQNFHRCSKQTSLPEKSIVERKNIVAPFRTFSSSFDDILKTSPEIPKKQETSLDAFSRFLRQSLPFVSEKMEIINTFEGLGINIG